MARQHYVNKNFRADALDTISTMTQIVDQYLRQSLRMTVRQLYYQLVARDIIENTENSYKRITSLVNDAKMAGLMDWEAMEDRTRSFIRRNEWESGAIRMQQVAKYYHEDMWVNQETRVFAIVEKEALAGVLEGVCQQFSMPLLAARGYPSGTVLREFAESDLLPALQSGQRCLILHLGDHDPSGIDMSRDLEERMRLFCGLDESGCDDYANNLEFDRIALNMHQIEELRPPPNPAKSTDARFSDYRRRYGSSSWELDALQPTYLAGLIRDSVEQVIDDERWQIRIEAIEHVKKELTVVSNEFAKKGI